MKVTNFISEKNDKDLFKDYKKTKLLKKMYVAIQMTIQPKLLPEKKCLKFIT